MKRKKYQDMGKICPNTNWIKIGPCIWTLEYCSHDKHLIPKPLFRKLSAITIPYNVFGKYNMSDILSSVFIFPNISMSSTLVGQGNFNVFNPLRDFFRLNICKGDY